MAGAGFDAAMIKGADDLKNRLGRAAYVVGGAAKLNTQPFEAKIKVDGTPLVQGPRELHPGRQRRRAVRRHRSLR
jgi:diacylglycerol kinase (ATP)